MTNTALGLGRLVVICAPSGTGKSTLLERLKKEFPQLAWSVSCTTRPIRTGEVNGRDYHFITKDDFEKRIAIDDFVEYATVHSNYYGTSKSFVADGLGKGESMLFDLDVQGALAMKKIYGAKSPVIFIEPPSVEELEIRLKKRATDAPHVIEERLRNARKELLHKNDFDFLITNDDVERAYKDLRGIVAGILKDAHV